MPEFIYAGFGVATYLVGAIPFGLVLVRALKGVNLRELGSGNIGATNAGREFGMHFFLLIFVLDLAKGFLPVFFAAPWIAETWPCSHCPAIYPSMKAWLAACAVAGHVFPIYLGFKGGKGVATGLGVSLALNWQASLIALGVFVAVLLAFRYVSLASVVAAFAAPTAHHFTSPAPWGDDVLITAFYLAVPVLVVVKHRHNLRRLTEGTEPRILAKKT